MTQQNLKIANILLETSLLLSLKEKDIFRSKAYKNAAEYIAKLSEDIFTIPKDLFTKQSGIGEGMLNSIEVIYKTGGLPLLEELKKEIPIGVQKMLNISGLGPKKVARLWKELKIENIDDLIKACKENFVANLKGFGLKTQESILENTLFIKQNQNKWHYAKVLEIADPLLAFLKEQLPNLIISFSGEFKRQLEVINKLDLVISLNELEDIYKIIAVLESVNYLELNKEDTLNIKNIIKNNKEGVGNELFFINGVIVQIPFLVTLCSKDIYYKELIKQSCSKEHLEIELTNSNSKTNFTIGDSLNKAKNLKSEEDFYKSVNIPYIPAYLRDGILEKEFIDQGSVVKVIQKEDIKGILHVHTTYSDGAGSLEQMALECIRLGFEYVGITDHSQAAAYAGGLKYESILKQHSEIDKLNTKLAPFKIFKGTEVDIMQDGSLDYNQEIMSLFDFSIASVHSGLNMDMSTATKRLIKAIENPFTTILGHPTARLLLKRAGYEIDYKKVIDACLENNVVIEVNSNPYRLDLDWRYIHYAIKKGVLLSINPDAHSTKGIMDIIYGIAVAQKGALTAKNTLNAMSKDQIESYFKL